MVAEKCPNCGAGISPNAPVCEYCGSALAQSNAVRKWTAITAHLPPPSQDNPNHSIMVLVCLCKDGGISIDEDGRVDYYASSVKSAYYDFQNKKWHNDFFGKKVEPIFVSHWMPLPSSGSTDWIPLVIRTPDLEGDIEGSSVDVLVCDKSFTYESSIINAQITLSNKKWLSGGIYAYSADLDAIIAVRTLTVSHWMPIPDRPTS
jgi:hypothetical protein